MEGEAAGRWRAPTGLFVLVEALTATGLVAGLVRRLAAWVSESPSSAAWGSGSALALVSNAMDNVPAGLIASSAIKLAHAPKDAIDALLIGVDLGTNISAIGSLATILWLTAIRCEGEDVGFWRFLGIGAIVMPPALVVALEARLGVRS